MKALESDLWMSPMIIFLSAKFSRSYISLLDGLQDEEDSMNTQGEVRCDFIYINYFNKIY